MQGQVQKWGNSLGVRLPKALTKELGLGCGETIDINIDGSRIVISKHVSQLDQLLQAINTDNLHKEEWPSKGVAGKEQW